MKEAIGKFRLASKGKTGLIYIPSDLVKDSSFPLRIGERVYIKIEGEKIVVMRIEENK